MVDSLRDPAYKFMIKDLCALEKCGNAWTYRFEESNKEVTLSTVRIQGKITKLAGLANEIIIIDDESGKARVTRGPHVPGDFSWLQTDTYCSVVGVVQGSGKLPHLAALKIVDNNNDTILQQSWPSEVMDLKGFLSGVLAPDIKSCISKYKEYESCSE